ncbi:hypothetical protein ASPSYDRAFT_781231 [Aspergillus sydowii CBS 593.65]|uniref:Uncharacterized protein n=1 Tax=Aspergillus sydowii CBS 593.65 TaxID=1036612 RepID=A0A1L9TNG3_9EURO|nr:uncharacterized protein ASPSYDRAFT_781231 [Aspergillus sydowii CBS 593.65]OJJ60967.1 hypothetical protein ASPSYDRAFT_781231 [Aspergillus sydowii CBS 593.65]
MVKARKKIKTFAPKTRQAPRVVGPARAENSVKGGGKTQQLASRESERGRSEQQVYLSGEVKTRKSRTEGDRSRPAPPQLIPSLRLAETTVASAPILAPRCVSLFPSFSPPDWRSRMGSGTNQTDRQLQTSRWRRKTNAQQPRPHRHDDLHQGTLYSSHCLL